MFLSLSLAINIYYFLTTNHTCIHSVGKDGMGSANSGFCTEKPASQDAEPKIQKWASPSLQVMGVIYQFVLPKDRSDNR